MYAGAVAFGVFCYLAPIGVMAARIGLGWHA